MEWLTMDLVVGICIGGIIGTTINWRGYNKMVWSYQEELFKMSEKISKLELELKEARQS